MTTAVIVRALHGWPVRVTHVQMLVTGGTVESESLVAAGEERTFYIWSGCDLSVHEIQPSEPGFAAPVANP